MNIVLSDIMKRNDFNAGSKARNDAKDILVKIGLRPHIVFNRNHGQVFKLGEAALSFGRLKHILGDGDVIVLQYPYNIGLVKSMTSRLAKLKGKRRFKVVYLLHDVYYIRGDQAVDGRKMRDDEIRVFNSVDYLIVHNHAMQEILSEDGVRTPMACLGLFDYLTDAAVVTPPPHERIAIDYAGNLAKEKSGFLYETSSLGNVSFNLYGIGYNGIIANNTYVGSFSPETLVGKLSGDYGLVWDGPTIDTCAGNYGEYLKYNNPHKFSLYIAAEKPVVVWKESALAEFVEKENIGRCVAGLKALESLPRSDSEAYGKMLANVRRFSGKVRSGEMLAKVMRDIIRDVADR